MEEKKINKTEITASLGKEVKLENLKSNKKVANFSVVINEKDKDPKWINCVAWDKTAEDISKIKPGTELNIIGAMKQNSWEKGEETKISETLTVYNFQDTKQMKQGYLTDDITIKKAGDHTVANFSIGLKGTDGEPAFIKCAAWNKAADQINGLKKGDELKIEGRHIQDTLFVNKIDVVTLKTDRDKAKAIFNPDSLTGYLTSNIELKNSGDKAVTNFSIGIKDVKEPTFVQCSAWEGIASKMGKLQKGDEIEIHGKITKDKKDQDVFHVNSCEVKSTKQERLDAKLVNAVESGNIGKTKELTKQGADVKAIKPEMISKHEGELTEMLKGAMKEGITEKSLAPEMQSNELSKRVKI